jgi:putative inorganic carbon (hco3(-)) transporter
MPILARSDSITRVLLCSLFAVWAAAIVISLFQAKKLIILAMVGATVFPLALYFSGNPRLFFLYGVIVSAPLGLSLNFKTMVHIGGAPSYAIDLMDFFLVPLIAFLIRDFASGFRQEIRFPPILLWWVGMMVLGGA